MPRTNEPQVTRAPRIVPDQLANENGPIRQHATDAINTSGTLAKATVVPIGVVAGLVAAISASGLDGDIPLPTNPVTGLLVGLITVPLGFVVDIAKAPVLLVASALTSGYAGLVGLSGLLFEASGDKKQEKAIQKSYEQRVKDIAAILIKTGTATKSQLYSRVKTGNIRPLIALSLLITAADSRHAPPGTLILANGMSLTRDKCPDKGKEVFDAIENIKTILPRLIADDDMEASRVILPWIPVIYNADFDSYRAASRADDNAITVPASLMTRLIRLSNTAKDLIDNTHTSHKQSYRGMNDSDYDPSYARIANGMRGRAELSDDANSDLPAAAAAASVRDEPSRPASLSARARISSIPQSFYPATAAGKAEKDNCPEKLERFIKAIEKNDPFTEQCEKLGIKDEIEEDFCCPISFELPNIPVTLDGQLFDYNFLVRCSDNNEGLINPTTRESFKLEELQPARFVVDFIERRIQERSLHNASESESNLKLSA